MDTKQITKIVIWSFYTYIGLSALSLVSTGMLNSFIISMENGLYYDNTLMMQKAEAHDLRESIIALFFIVINIVCIISFLRWTYKSSQISHLSGAKDLKFSPGWSVGWFFIPIATLWKPYQAFKQIYQVSIQVVDWKNVSIPSEARWWWGLFILTSIINNFLFRIYLSMDVYENSAIFSTIFIIEIIVATIETITILIIIKLVKGISQRYNSADFQSNISGDNVKETPTNETNPQNENPKQDNQSNSSPTKTEDIFFDNRKPPSKKSTPEKPVIKELEQKTAPNKPSSDEDDVFFDNRRKK